MSQIQASLKIILFLTVCVLFTQCSKDDETTLRGEVQVEITDSPIDEASVRSVFVTIADVKIDGKSFDGFSGKTTIDLLAYQRGDVKLLGLGEVDAKTYNSIELVLDYDTDMSGNAPGCYVLDTNNNKMDLSGNNSGSQSFRSNTDFEVMAEQKSTIVIDFDLRKAIRYADNTTSGMSFEFASDAKVASAIRVVNKDQTGTIEGEVTDNMSGSEQIVVYAYKEGRFNKEQEVSADNDIQFENAVSSSAVDAQGNYKLAFLTAGKYELVFVSYKGKDQDGRLEMNAYLDVSTALNLDLLGLDVTATNQVTANVIVTGMKPI